MASTKKRVYTQTEDEEASQMEPGVQGSDNGADEARALRKEVKALRKDLSDLKTQMEAFDFAIHEYEEGKKISALKKSLGMQKYLYAWMKNAEEKMPALKLGEKHKD